MFFEAHPASCQHHHQLLLVHFNQLLFIQVLIVSRLETEKTGEVPDIYKPDLGQRERN